MLAINENDCLKQTVTKLTNIRSSPEKASEWKVLDFCLKTYCRFRLIGILAGVMIYIFLGGLLFRYFESQHEIDMNRQKIETLTSAANNLTLMILSIVENETNSNETKLDAIQRLISQYQKSEGLFPKDSLMWSLLGGIFFSGTVVTTIGYGNLYPLTTNGRIAVMVYAFFGIPTMLFLLAEIGKSLKHFLNKFWFHFRRLLTSSGVRRKDKENAVQVFDEDVEFPVLLAIAMALLWTVFCSAVFCIWEKSWTFFDAFYFFFISTSTIGFGDVMPDHTEYLICNPILIVGLCFVSLVAHLMQKKIENFKKRTDGYVHCFGGSVIENNLEGQDEENEKPKEVLLVSDEENENFIRKNVSY